MANGPTLPPQAYTREILTAAFNWLQSQPESVRKLATTPDALVGLFMRAQRYGNSSLEADAPVSSQSFMSDLKSLAEGLKQFEGPKETRRYSAPTTQNIPSPPSPAPANHGNNIASGHTPTFSGLNSSARPAAQSSFGLNATFAGELSLSGLNENSLRMIQEVKTYFNLSSETEAINMMVALAYKNLKNLLA
jgi:hypothetical protein